ncbi:MAG: hypothetical protein J6W29_01485, partial [Neisseriaceae bacterium]|nr:hypothetical protein [Neisseriaceae bacterium]
MWNKILASALILGSLAGCGVVFDSLQAANVKVDHLKGLDYEECRSVAKGKIVRLKTIQRHAYFGEDSPSLSHAELAQGFRCKNVKTGEKYFRLPNADYILSYEDGETFIKEGCGTLDIHCPSYWTDKGCKINGKVCKNAFTTCLTDEENKLL